MIANANFLTCYVDGGMLGHRNPSPEGVYWSVVIETTPPETLRCQSERYHTNNDAEWLALRECLRRLVALQVRTPIVIYSDSEYMTKQFNGEWRVRIGRHVRIYFECKRLATELPWLIVQMPQKPPEPEGWPRGQKWLPDWRPRDLIVAKVGH